LLKNNNNFGLRKVNRQMLLRVFVNNTYNS